MPPPGCSAARMATEALFARDAANLDEEFDAGALGSQDDAGSTDSGGEDEVEAGSGPCAQENARRSQRNTSRVVARKDELAAYVVGSLVEVRKSGKGSFWNAKVVKRRSGTDAAGKHVEEAQMKYVDEEGNYTRNRALWLTIGDLDRLRPPQPSKEEAAAAKETRRQEKKEEPPRHELSEWSQTTDVVALDIDTGVSTQNKLLCCPCAHELLERVLVHLEFVMRGHSSLARAQGTHETSELTVVTPSQGNDILVSHHADFISGSRASFVLFTLN